MTIHVLVASADSKNVERVKEAFRWVDCTVIKAPSMSLALFLTQKNFPDLIFSDLELTDGDGLRFIEEIKLDRELRSIPFVFFVHDLSELDAQTAGRHGARALIGPSTRTDQILEMALPLIEERLKAKGRRPEETPE